MGPSQQLGAVPGTMAAVERGSLGAHQPAAGTAEFPGAAEGAVAAVAPEAPLHLQEVDDFVGTLEEAVACGEVPQPPLVSWAAWRAWRSTQGRAPPIGTNLERGAYLRAEGALHRATMERLYGPTWRARLRDYDQEAEEAGDLPDPAALEGHVGLPAHSGPPVPSATQPTVSVLANPADAAGVATAGGAGSDSGGGSDFSQGSWATLSSGEVREALMKDFDPTTRGSRQFREQGGQGGGSAGEETHLSRSQRCAASGPPGPLLDGDCGIDGGRGCEGASHTPGKPP